MGHIHYRVRRPRHGRPYRAPAAVVRRTPSLPQPQPPTGRGQMRKEGLGVVSRNTTAAWRGLLAPDGTPPARPLQIAYVRRAVWRETGTMPSLKGLTIGQAERVLGAVGADARPLWRAGRSAGAANLAAVVTKWLIVVLLCMELLALGRIAGVPFVLVVMGVATLAFTRRQRRQAFEDRHYRGPGAPGTTSETQDGQPPPDGPVKPPRGSPYDVATYLRRLNEDGP
ncbi:hypothetical protein [Sinomonas mesophila]|uniref:hypothetical protein n=1 Tax=Sinomonas mesophila TaxID=1531955 RepID=UPI00111575C5|nr:hypothetical protein [Sinomonas mesophila]